MGWFTTGMIHTPWKVVDNPILVSNTTQKKPWRNVLSLFIFGSQKIGAQYYWPIMTYIYIYVYVYVYI